MYVKAFAKINLYLDVISKKEDGYHNLNMIMLPLELHDLIEIECLPYLVDSYVTCDHVDLGETKYNLIHKTIVKLRELYKFRQNFNINVHKEIPIKAGLGGGSSNSAAVLKAFNKILKLNISDEEMVDIAKRLGADVPYCLLNKPAHVEGIGEIVTPIECKKQYSVVIVKPKKGLKTTDVFAMSDKMELEHGNIDGVVKALKDGDDDLLAQSMFNALEKVSIQMAPEIQEIKNRLHQEGFKMVLMSGSGSATYALTSDKGLAKNVYHKLEKEGYEVYLTRTFK